MNEPHSAAAVIDGRKVVRLPRNWCSVDVTPDRVNRPEVDVRKCLQIPLGMPPRDPRRCPRIGGKVLGAAAGERLARFTVSIQLEVVRILLLPQDRTF